MTEQKAIHPYMKVLEPFSSEEIDQITQVKRFFEWVQGDLEFRQSADSGNLAPVYRERLKNIGVTIALEELALLWEQPGIAQCFLTTMVTKASEALPAEVLEAIKRYPVLELWGRYCAHKNSIYRALRKRMFHVDRAPDFEAWRQRRIASVRNELGFFGHVIDHPILAFELGDGCNVGCWFCAFATRKLKTNFDYPENRDFFRDVVQGCVDKFGKNPASMAMLYYGTEPHDNPHYLDFMKDYAELTGSPLCTSTAVGDDPVWLRQLIAFYRVGTHPWPRLSVLSTAMLHKIHELYTPEELRDVELLMQMKDHHRRKVSGGRILKEEEGLRGREEGHYMDGIVPQGSIACVSGFLINMVRRTIQLVSPCYTSEQWPYGYRVFDTVTFDKSPTDFERALQALIGRNMPRTPYPDHLARFRDDLTYRPTAEGFDLCSPNQVHHFSGQGMYGLLGRLIAAGNLTYQQLSDAMMDDGSLNPLLAADALQKMFDGGFLDEVNPTQRYAKTNGEAAAA